MLLDEAHREQMQAWAEMRFHPQTLSELGRRWLLVGVMIEAASYYGWNVHLEIGPEQTEDYCCTLDYPDGDEGRVNETYPHRAETPEEAVARAIEQVTDERFPGDLERSD